MQVADLTLTGQWFFTHRLLLPTPALSVPLKLATQTQGLCPRNLTMYLQTSNYLTTSSAQPTTGRPGG
jgi:hypothetical protein